MTKDRVGSRRDRTSSGAPKIIPSISLEEPLATEEGPFYVRLAEELESLIRAGEYGPEDKLPTEHELAERYSINRHTAARALNRLQARGLVHRVRGQGSFVFSGRIDFRVAEKMSFTDSVSRLGLSPSQKILSVRKVRAHRSIAKRMFVPDGEPLIAFEQLRYAGQVPLIYGTKHFRERLLPGVADYLRGYRGSLRALIRDQYGLEMRRARSIFEIESADQDISRLLAVSPGVELLKVESLDILEDGTPAEWGTAYFRGNAARVQVEICEVKEERDRS